MADAPETAGQRRRRWLTIGEVVGVLALLISAAGLWESHRARVEERADAAAVKPVSAAPLVLTARVADDGDTLALSATRDRVIQTQGVRFPTALAAGRQDTVGNPRLEAGWFAAELRDALPGKHVRGRVPVAIVTRYLDDGVLREDTAIYDIGHGWRSRLLASDMPALEGITLVSRSGKDVQRRLDARWAALHPGAAQASAPQ